jgi:serine/threonine-protein kinase
LPSDSRVGEVLASKYRLQELLGSGGMGDVYRAVNEAVGRAVAIKVLRAEHTENAGVMERFLREARAANLVRHPNVVDVLDIGTDAAGVPFIVQELLVGEDLASLVARRGGKLPSGEVCRLMLPVVDAVAAAHTQGVVHRDIKPENVFLCRSEQGAILKLLDFGISKIRAPDVQKTEAGVLMGTPAYMAPEQLQGGHEADPRSDVWALGVMMFELIAGRMPFDVPDAPSLFEAVATRDAPTLQDVGADTSASVSSLVDVCLRRDPNERYRDAGEVGQALRRVLDTAHLEEAAKRPSLAPVSARRVPDLALPEGRRSTPRGGPSFDDPSVDALLSAPSLPPPEAPALAGSDTAEGLEPHATSGGHPASLSLATDGPAGVTSMSGVGLAPGAPRGPRLNTPKAYRGEPLPTPEAREAPRAAADYSALVGIGVVGLAAIFGTALLMALAHRGEGWPMAQFLFAPSATVATVFHGLFALLGVALGLSACRRGVLHWRHELAGGPAGALLNALVASGAFFAAIELVTAL